MYLARRSSLNLKTLLFSQVDLFCMLLLTSVLMWLACAQSSLFRGFPESTADTFFSEAAETLLVIWSVAQMLKELLRRMPDHD